MAKPIDNVTVTRLDLVLRMTGILLDTNLLDKIIDVVELIEDKGDDVSLKDMESMKSKWEK